MARNAQHVRKGYDADVERRARALDRQDKSEQYPCGHAHVPGNQHFCPTYTYAKESK